MDENEKPRDEGAEEDNSHESAHQDEETAPVEDQLSEDECDEAIAELLATIAALESRVGELEHKLEQHGIDFEHTARRVEPGAALDDTSPDERHFYFRRIGRR